MKPTPTPTQEMIKAACAAVILGEDEDGNPVHLQPSEAQAALSAALSVPAAAVVGEPVAWTTQAQIDKFKVDPGCNAVMWGEPLPHHPDIPLYAAPSAPDGWQPIETAPKDGATIWVLDEIYGKPWHYECNWNGIEWYHGFGVAWPDARPTHWRPLPAPPALGGKP